MGWTGAEGRKPAASEGSLVDRETQTAALERALSDAAAGSGQVAYIEAGPGTGKSRLLAFAAGQARTTGMLVLRAAGRELERGFPFGVAIQLLEPAAVATRSESFTKLVALSDGDDIFPQIHRLFARVRNMASPAAPADRSPDAGATIPLALIVDDVDRADRASQRFLAYLGVRLAELPIALLVAARREAPATEDPALALLRDAAGDHVLVLEPLSPDGAAQLVRDQLPRAGAAFQRECARISGGNPLLLTELVREVRRAHPGVRTPPTSLIDDAVPDSVVRLVAARLTALGPECEAFARAVAVLGDEAALQRAAEVAALHGDEGGRAADALAAASLLRPGQPLAFAQPLIARAVLLATPELAREHLTRRAAAGVGRPPQAEAEAPERPAVEPRAHADPMSVDEPPTPEQRLVLAQMTIHGGLHGEHRNRIRDLAELAWGDGALLDGVADDDDSPPRLVQALLFADELERGWEILGDSRHPAPAEAGPGATAIRSSAGVWILYHQGQVQAALVAAGAALGASSTDAAAVGLSAAIAACRIQLDQLDQAEAGLGSLLATDVATEIDLAILLDVRAQLRLAQKRPRDALEDALEAGRAAASVHGGLHPGIVAWRTTAALARLALDDHAAARQLANEELELARGNDFPRVYIRALRVLGLASAGKRRLDLLAEAVNRGAEQPVRLEYVHALVEYGAATRRANRRTAAREPLTRALDLAGGLGLTSLAQRAEHELAATSSRQRPLVSGVAGLTPSERRVADLAAQGRTTKQIASELFVTPKTVEFHLRHVYRKLEVPSTREALTRALRLEGIGEPVPE